MKKVKFLVLISILLFGTFAVNANSLNSDEVLKQVVEKPYDSELLFMASVVNYFKGDYDNSLKYFVRASVFDRAILVRKDYGMIDALTNYTKEILNNSQKTELKIYSCIFLDKLGEKKYSYAHLQNLYNNVKDESQKITISRILNSIRFMNTL
ncbi:MAG: hypothetical protein M0R46_05130 [Candidatus Muirbacterium halophilum]|nr:hypothetical protein [Candidatus Muirbacterium halophilum]MCK9475278.1 hypothetical protein [Candidatus Muirbacterium halophilum]